HLHVGRFDVAMDYEARVCVRDGVEHREEKADPLLDVESMLVAVLVDRQAVDVFEHEVRLVVRAYAGIEQPRDIRVRKLCEVPAFQGEALRSRAPGGTGEELHCNLALEPAVASLRAPHRAHAATAE